MVMPPSLYVQHSQVTTIKRTNKQTNLEVGVQNVFYTLRISVRDNKDARAHITDKRVPALLVLPAVLKAIW